MRIYSWKKNYSRYLSLFNCTAGTLHLLEDFFDDPSKKKALFLHVDTLMRPLTNCHFVADVLNCIFRPRARFVAQWPTTSPNAAQGKFTLPPNFCGWAEDLVCRHAYANAEFRVRAGAKTGGSVLVALR